MDEECTPGMSPSRIPMLVEQGYQICQRSQKDADTMQRLKAGMKGIIDRDKWIQPGARFVLNGAAGQIMHQLSEDEFRARALAIEGVSGFEIPAGFTFFHISLD